MPSLALAFSADGGTLAIARDGRVELRDGRTGKPRKEFAVPGLRAEGAVFSPDGRTLALASPGSAGASKLEVLELASGKVRLERDADFRASGMKALAFSPSGGKIATQGQGGMPLLYDTMGRTESRGGISRATADNLSSRSGAVGYSAMGQLIRSPEKAVKLLRARFAPARPPADDDKMAQYLALMQDHDPDFSTAAMDALVDEGHKALSPLRVARAEAKRADVRAGLKRLIDEIDQPFSPRTIRETRAVEVLERIGTKDAVRLLKELARGHPDIDLTREAKAALARMEKR
jgi:hypothetical protein